jgi:hypothetical protein
MVPLRHQPINPIDEEKRGRAAIGRNFGVAITMMYGENVWCKSPWIRLVTSSRKGMNTSAWTTWLVESGFLRETMAFVDLAAH